MSLPPINPLADLWAACAKWVIAGACVCVLGGAVYGGIYLKGRQSMAPVVQAARQGEATQAGTAANLGVSAKASSSLVAVDTTIRTSTIRAKGAVKEKYDATGDLDGAAALWESEFDGLRDHGGDVSWDSIGVPDQVEPEGR